MRGRLLLIGFAALGLLLLAGCGKPARRNTASTRARLSPAVSRSHRQSARTSPTGPGGDSRTGAQTASASSTNQSQQPAARPSPARTPGPSLAVIQAREREQPTNAWLFKHAPRPPKRDQSRLPGDHTHSSVARVTRLQQQVGSSGQKLFYDPHGTVQVPDDGGQAPSAR